MKGKQWLPVSIADKVTKAEILLALKLVASNYSFSSYGDIGDICKVAFADSEIAQRMQLGSTKVSYLIVHGLAPYFRSAFVADCIAGKSYYTILFDETTTRQVKKQLDFHIAYWSKKWKKVVTVFVDSVFLGHADANKLCEKMLKFIEDHNLDISHLLQFSMDGPNVNLSFKQKFNSVLASKGFSQLVDIGTCSLHPLHTAFTKGVEKLPFEVDQFANDVFTWFKLSAARREDYKDVKAEELLEVTGEFFLRPVSSRWLSLEPVCRRLLEQFEVLKKYFIVTLPAASNSKSVCSGDRYKRIRVALSDDSTKVYLNFVAFAAANLMPFLKLFQRSEPLIHVLYEKLNEMLRALMMKFMKASVVDAKEGQSLLDLKCDDTNNWVHLSSMDVGIGTKTALLAIIKEEDRKKLRYSMRSSLIAMVSYLQSRLPLSNPILRDLQCLHPIARKAEGSKLAIAQLTRHLRIVTKTDEFCDKVQAEWLLYMCESNTAVCQWSDDSMLDICSYWNAVADICDGVGEKKYANLCTLVKSALTLSHGNAVPERGFSVNNSLLAKERLALSEQTIIAERIIKEVVRITGTVADIPVTKDLIICANKAHADYLIHLEKQKHEQRIKDEEKRKLEAEQKEKVEILERKQAICKLMAEQDSLEVAQMQEQDIAKQLIGEASSKLATSLQHNDLKDAKVAQVMLSAGNSKLQETSQHLTKIREAKQKLQKKLAQLELKGTGSSKAGLEPPAAKKKKWH
jgi:hypothetical protein